MRSGHVYERPTSAPPTSANGGSSSPGLPTPRARDSKGRGYEDALPNVVELLPTPTTSENTGVGDLEGNRNDTLRAQIAMLPTPRASDTGTPGRRASEGFRPPLSQVLLPTPRASAQENRQTKRSPTQKAGKHGLCLAAEVSELLPTPTSADSTRGRTRRGGDRSGEMLLTEVAHQASAGALTAQPSPDGSGSSDDLPLGQLTIEDALTLDSSNG